MAGKIKDYLLRWVIPVGFTEFYTRIRKGSTFHYENPLATRSNAKYKNVHKNERCFILANGPSVNRQDITKLKNEVVFSVSNGYLHADYATIAPRYHCVPQLTYTDLFTEATAVAWFTEMDRYLGEAELFLSTTEFDLVEKHKLFPGRTISYLDFDGAFSDRTHSKIPDISRSVPRVQSVPVMCLMIALYMGFKEIYLLGVDHDAFRTGTYTYAFQPTVLSNTDINLKSDGGISLYEEFKAHAALWEQYRALRTIAAENGARIINATHGGALDEFERIDFNTLISS